MSATGRLLYDPEDANLALIYDADDEALPLLYDAALVPSAELEDHELGPWAYNGTTNLASEAAALADSLEGLLDNIAADQADSGAGSREVTVRAGYTSGRNASAVVLRLAFEGDKAKADALWDKLATVRLLLEATASGSAVFWDGGVQDPADVDYVLRWGLADEIPADGAAFLAACSNTLSRSGVDETGGANPPWDGFSVELDPADAAWTYDDEANEMWAYFVFFTYPVTTGFGTTPNSGSAYTDCSVAVRKA